MAAPSGIAPTLVSHSTAPVFRLSASISPVGFAPADALNLKTGAVEWDTKVGTMPLGAATVVNNLVFTALYTGQLIAVNRATGAIVYSKSLPTTVNAPLAIAGNTVLVAAGGPGTGKTGGNPQLVAYTLP